MCHREGAMASTIMATTMTLQLGTASSQADRRSERGGVHRRRGDGGERWETGCGWDSKQRGPSPDTIQIREETQTRL